MCSLISNSCNTEMSGLPNRYAQPKGTAAQARANMSGNT